MIPGRGRGSFVYWEEFSSGLGEKLVLEGRVKVCKRGREFQAEDRAGAEA